MPDTIDNAFLACQRALEDMILPAIDEANPLAVEQAQLVLRMLGLLRARATLLHPKARKELELNRSAALAVAGPLRALDPTVADRLEVEAGAAGHLLADPAATTDALNRSAAAIASLIGTAVGACGPRDDPAARQVERIAIDSQGALIDLHRAWFAPTGFDDTAHLPPLDILLAAPKP